MLHTAESAANPERAIAAGDLVVIYEGFDSMKAVRVSESGSYNNKYGGFAHKDWIGRPFGSKVVSRKGSGWVLLLAPTPELWTTVLRHRTQILYAADIAMVVAQLELRPGAAVLESGTGSGSLTHSLARAVAPTGHVHTFEFHEQRAQLAAEEFAANGLGGLVTVKQQDIEECGFPAELHGTADAVFLDLPKPYKVVPSAAACLRPDGVFCAFSPCIEQVQRTCQELNARGFRDMRTMEVLLRQWEVSRQALLTDMEAPPPPRARKQQAGGGGGERGAKRQRAEGGAAAPPGAAGSGQATDGDAGAEPAAEAGAEPTAEAGTEPAAEAEAEPAAAAPQQRAQQQREAVARQVVSRPVPFGRGHTGYLTFARRVVALA